MNHGPFVLSPQRLFIAGIATLMLLGAGCAGSRGQDRGGDGRPAANGTVEDRAAENENLKARLLALEPDRPTRIETDADTERTERFLAANRLVPLDRLAGDGIAVSFRTVAEDDTWARPAYAEAWHSTFMGGKFASVADLLRYARDDFYIYTGGTSEGSGIYHRLGFSEEWDKPLFGGTKPYPDEPENGFEVIAVAARIREIRRLGNQWLVTVEPGLRGYHTVSVTYGAARLAGKEPEDVLFRFATPEGYEIERHVAHLPVR